MKSLSIAQEYLLCSLNEKGKLPILNKKIQVCIVASGLLELLFFNWIQLDEKDRVLAIRDPGEEAAYLKSLYSWLYQSAPIGIKKIARNYCLTLSDSKLRSLVEAIGTSLADEGCVTKGKGGIFGNSPRFIPHPDSVDRVIQKIRAELLESGTMTDETVALVSLLDKGGQIKNYFSKYESQQLRTRLKEIQETPFNKMVKRMVDHIETMIIIISTAGRA
jgi:hypothetical protein